VNDERLKEMELYAWVGEDELGSGEYGLKAAIVPAGYIPIVATSEAKVDQPYIQDQMRVIAEQFDKPRYLVRFTFAGVVRSIEPAATERHRRYVQRDRDETEG
jgi:hypothetical protein